MYVNSGMRKQPVDDPSNDLFTVVGQQSVAFGLSREKKFGIVPSSIFSTLSDDNSELRARAHAAEELKLLVENCRDVHLVEPHFDDFVEFLGDLLDDHNSKVSTAVVDVISALVQQMSKELLSSKAKLLVTKLCRRLGDTNGVVRVSVTKTFTHLMRVASAATVLDSLCTAGISHRNARVRQETLNLAIIALLTFPSSDFDLPRVAKTVAVALIDGRRPVRQAALECYAVLAQAMGPSKRSFLMDNVSGVALQYGIGHELMDAVIARLSNRQLPKHNSSGLIEYVALLNRCGGTATPTPDLEWILSASSGHGSSAVSDGSASSRRSSQSSTPGDFQPFEASRLRRSGRRGFARLPWDSEV